LLFKLQLNRIKKNRLSLPRVRNLPRNLLFTTGRLDRFRNDSGGECSRAIISRVEDAGAAQRNMGLSWRRIMSSLGQTGEKQFWKIFKRFAKSATVANRTFDVSLCLCG